MQELEEKVERKYARSRLQGVAVTGVGGAGKTQLVLEYVEKHNWKYDTILWWNAESEETLRSSITECCAELRLSVSSQDEHRKQSLAEDHSVKQLLRWLRSRLKEQAWLVISDNADSPSLLSTLQAVVPQMVPITKCGTIINTSQDTHATRLLDRGFVRVDQMEVTEAQSLLEAAFNNEDIPIDDAFHEMLGELASVLDRFPLALELARAAISEKIDAGHGASRALEQ
jgi:hypothetical protein